MSRSLALTDIPNEVQKENVLEILSRHGVLKSWTKGMATARYLDVYEAFHVRFTVSDQSFSWYNFVFPFVTGLGGFGKQRHQRVLPNEYRRINIFQDFRYHRIRERPKTNTLWLAVEGTLGHIASVSVLGRRIVVINSAQTAIDILDKKGAIYSDRPIVAMGRELVGWKNAFVLMRYSSRFSDSRRRVHQIFGTNTSFKQFLPVVELEALKVFAKPEDLFRDI
ncbi:uncharacterized protein ARMOST_06371 [Armillaria ostoyae]|uniref:Uncharacterized protein n=1 Tax=Armillaria ostoyae TaxID=47428 RepID=A0A284R2U0_ARMOS|nr:uncharacterized protein ARMOST_06371 [Armillaria ostoyae]